MTPVAMTIAGSDPSGGAGIQADLKTFDQHGPYGTSLITLPFSPHESLSEAQFMRVRICNVEEALAPRRILRRIGL